MEYLYTTYCAATEMELNKPKKCQQVANQRDSITELAMYPVEIFYSHMMGDQRFCIIITGKSDNHNYEVLTHM